jgi:hypothetical protein
MNMKVIRAFCLTSFVLFTLAATAADGPCNEAADAKLG